MTLYEILGVPKDATLQMIKHAYRELSKVNHPDKGGDTEIMNAINEAYRILSDPKKRKDYDEGKAEAREENRARDIILSLVSSNYEKMLKNPESFDIVGTIKRKIIEDIDNCEKDQKMAINMIEKTELILEKVKNSDIIKNALKHNISDLKQSIEHSKRLQKDLSDAMSLVSEAFYDFGPIDKDDFYKRAAAQARHNQRRSPFGSGRYF